MNEKLKQKYIGQFEDLIKEGKVVLSHRKSTIVIGADDYITKPFNILEVKARIKAIMRRTSPERAPQVQSSVIEKGDIKLDCDSRRLFINDNEINLTAREFELLEILIKIRMITKVKALVEY